MYVLGSYDGINISFSKQMIGNGSEVIVVSDSIEKLKKYVKKEYEIDVVWTEDGDFCDRLIGTVEEDDDETNEEQFFVICKVEKV